VHRDFLNKAVKEEGEAMAMQRFAEAGDSASYRDDRLSLSSVTPTGVPHATPLLAEGSDPVEQTRILLLLNEIGRDLASILDIEDLLRAAGERVRQLVKYDLFSVMLLNQETQLLESAFALRYDQRIQSRTRLALGEGLCGSAALDRKAIRVNAVDRDPRYIRCEVGLSVKSELVVPLIAKGRLLGVLDLESLEADAFTERNELMLVILASTLAIALDNARLYDELRRAEQRMARDLERARAVQQALLPEEQPDLAGIEIAARYMPAHELGGDFYDLLPYGENRLAIAVGDVSGKGSAAALLAALGIGLLREHAVQHPCSPEEMLKEINRHLQMSGTGSQFVAMAFAVYDGAKRELCVANAGFPMPVLVRNGTAVPLKVAGVPLGLFPDTSYESLNLSLQEGDVVVFCSDGIHEQTNPSEEEFGVARLVSHLARIRSCDSADRIAGDILQATTQHAGDRAECDECRDDRTIVVLRVR
jgi:sigma-B regulation protein RsbU (phosphoserine phosphatase)